MSEPAPEQYVAAVGDKVRVVVEGGVTRTTPSGDVEVNARTTVNPRDGHVVSVEYVAPPLPDALGSVLEVDGARWVRLQPGWVDVGQPGAPARDDDMAGRRYSVRYDAATGV